jgi:hypothetical protein
MGIKDQLKNLSEDDLRQKVLIPLMFGLGCQDVRDNCGPSELGKDVLYLSRDHFLREKVWGAILLKATDINKASLENIHRQLSDAINQFTDPDDPRNKIQLQEILIVTSRRITPDAQKYIHEQSGKNFQNVHFVTGDRLEFLINQVIIEYNQRTNTKYNFTVETFAGIFGQSTTTEQVSMTSEGNPIE